MLSCYFLLSIQEDGIGFVKDLDFWFSKDLYILGGSKDDLSVHESVCLSLTQTLANYCVEQGGILYEVIFLCELVLITFRRKSHKNPQFNSYKLELKLVLKLIKCNYMSSVYFEFH